MFDILVYLYETYYRPDACPDAQTLAKKLTSVGFDEDEISEAIDWLSVLAATTKNLQQQAESTGFRIYVPLENAVLGSAAIGFMVFLESTKLLTAQQREIVIECALALNETPISLDKLKIIGKIPVVFFYTIKFW